MLLIGRLLYQEGPVEEAVRAREAGYVRDLARKQAEAEAQMLELDLGPARRGLSQTLSWLVDAVQEAVDLPLAIRTADLEALRDVLPQVKGRVLIDAAAPAVEDWRAFVRTAKAHDAQIALASCLRGLPTSIEERLSLATEELIPAALEAGVGINALYIDPFIAALNCDQPQAPVAVEALRLLKVAAEVVPNTLVHLEDISDGVQPVEARSVINQVYLAMLMGAGLDAAIADLTNPRLQDTVRLIKERDGSTPVTRLLLRMHDSAGAGMEIDPAVVDLEDPELALLYKTWQVLENQIIYADGLLGR
jgi:5-methyltetrahydrofolate--homocysteine methyltransferase